MEKLVVKTAVKTVLIILAIFIVAFAVFNFAFPHYMASVTESMGNYSLAVKYADLRYSYTKKPEDLARCFDDSVLLEDDVYIIKYGDKLIESSTVFNDVCKTKNEEYRGSKFDYKHWVYSKLSVAYYNVGTEEKNAEKVEKAFTLAKLDNGSETFVYGNALMTLSARIASQSDVESAKRMLGILENGEGDFDKIAPTDKEEKENLSIVISMMNTTAKK